MDRGVVTDSNIVDVRYLLHVPDCRIPVSALYSRLLSPNLRFAKAKVGHIFPDGPRHLLWCGKYVRHDAAMQTTLILLGRLEGRSGWTMHSRRAPFWLHTRGYRNPVRSGYHNAPSAYVGEIANVSAEKASNHVHVRRGLYHYYCQLPSALGSGPVRPKLKSYL
jgi:hypothetical protein